jgi:hypothetical protein
MQCFYCRSLIGEQSSSDHLECKKVVMIRQGQQPEQEGEHRVAGATGAFDRPFDGRALACSGAGLTPNNCQFESS